jgi:hypothetical protein
MDKVDDSDLQLHISGWEYGKGPGVWVWQNKVNKRLESNLCYKDVAAAPLISQVRTSNGYMHVHKSRYDVIVHTN